MTSLGPVDDWEEMLFGFWHAADAAVTLKPDVVPVIIGWMRDEFSHAMQTDWHNPSAEKAAQIRAAQYEGIVEFWRARSVMFRGSDALEASIAELPGWMKLPSPTSDGNYGDGA